MNSNANNYSVKVTIGRKSETFTTRCTKQSTAHCAARDHARYAEVPCKIEVLDPNGVTVEVFTVGEESWTFKVLNGASVQEVRRAQRIAEEKAAAKSAAKKSRTRKTAA